MYEAKYGTIQGKEIKIFAPKKILQRLSIALVQVKSEDLSQNPKVLPWLLVPETITLVGNKNSERKW